MGFSKHVDTPNPFVSSELPRDNCAPSVVDGACGQDAVSTSPFFPLNPPPTPFSPLLFSCPVWLCSPPPKTHSHVRLVYISLCVLNILGVSFFFPPPNACACGSRTRRYMMCACLSVGVR